MRLETITGANVLILGNFPAPLAGLFYEVILGFKQINIILIFVEVLNK